MGKRSGLILAFAVVWWASLAACQQDTRADVQLEINREALLNKGLPEQIRVDAAYLLLLSPQPAARKVILDCLSQPDQTAAHAVICKAISKAKAVPNPGELIGPLMRLLSGPDQVVARLAAEAAVAFGYDTIGPSIERMVLEPNVPLVSRVNAIYALRLQPDKRAAITLLTLIDDPNSQVVLQAREALHAMGIPEGKDKDERRQIVKELRAKTWEEFMKDWVAKQEQLLQAEKERLKQEQERMAQFWTSLIETTDQLYGLLPNDQEKANLLIRHLKGPDVELRLWAINKLYQWRTSGRPIPQDFGPLMAAVIADQDRRVRLEAARVLSITGQLGNTEQLISRLDAEQDEQVKAMLLLALGQACDYALGTSGGPQIGVEVRQKTLEWADRFLSTADPNRARAGAQVIQRLLDKPGILPPAEVDRYLQRLQQRLLQVTGPEAGLRADILRVMGLLCGPQSGCREQACKRFGPVFERAYTDQDDRVRELAVEGMILVDGGLALQRLRQGAMNEKNPNIRAKVIELAGEVGRPEDLDWLATRLTPGSPDLDGAWRAFSAILTRSEPSVASQWLARFRSQDLASRLPAQWLSLLQLLERKAAGQPDLLRQVLADLVDYHKLKGDLEAQAAIMPRLLELADGQQRAMWAGELLGVYVGLGRLEDAAGLLQRVLEQGDLDEQDPMVLTLGQMKQSGKVDLDAVLKMVVVKERRPNWERIRQSLLGLPNQG